MIVLEAGGTNILMVNESSASGWTVAQTMGAFWRESSLLWLTSPVTSKWAPNV